MNMDDRDEEDIIANTAAPAYGGPYDVDGCPIYGFEQISFDVVLVETTHRINTMKVVRDIMGGNILDAKKVVDGTPALIKEDVGKYTAEDIASALRDAGGIVKIR